MMMRQKRRSDAYEANTEPPKTKKQTLNTVCGHNGQFLVCQAAVVPTFRRAIIDDYAEKK